MSDMTRRLFFIVLSIMGFLLPASAQLIDDFSYQNSEGAKKTWRAIDGSPPVTIAPAGGLAFTLPFSTDRDRVYWDRDGIIDLSGYTGFELDITCDLPQAMRSLSIYFRSGSGWYIWNQPLPAAGRQIIQLQKGHFSTEGNPSGWENIDKIRISPWKGKSLDGALIIHNFSGRNENLFLIQATASAPNATERSVARRTTERLSGWLKECGIPHAVVTEDQMEVASREASVLVFPYNPKIPAPGITALRTFSKRGGKLVVFYSSDYQLAELMGVSIGAITNTRDIARWRGMVFEKSAPPGVPPSVHQQSWTIGLASPTSESGRVMAWWMTASDQASSDPAIIATPQGYWFTHILLDDDELAKQKMLTALLASLDTSIWKTAADHMRLNAGRIDGWSSSSQAVNALNQLAEHHPNGDTIRAFTRRIEINQRKLIDFHREEKFIDAVVMGYELNDLLRKTYGLAQSPATHEFRGVWDHDATGWYPGDWDRTAKILSESGITAIFINASWAGLAHYPSKVLPQSYTFRIHGDQLEQCIKAAHKYGIEVHAWIVCWYLENSPAEFSNALKNSDRLQQTSKGAERLWMNPAHPANTRHHLDIISEILENYDVDGIHLDYIRYPDSDSCYSPFTRSQFESDTGNTVAEWPQDVMSGGPQQQAFIQWRAGTISAFVKQARQLANKTKPNVRLSAAVWGLYPQIIQSIGQDWGSWIKDGIIDFVCPMNYAEDLYKFTSLTDQQLNLPGIRGKLYPGIGVTASESQLRSDQVVEQILALRQRGVRGFALFDLSQTLKDETLPTLRMGVTRP